MSDNTPDATIHILRDIQSWLGRVETELSDLHREVRENRDDVRGRPDNPIAIFGGAYRDHDRRISYVEARVDRLDPPPPPRRRR